MRIKAIYVENFRSIKSETLSCDPLTVIVGANGAGKSSFLQALAVFYDVSARLDVEDYCGRRTEEAIVIRVTYGDLRPDEREEFKAYISKDTLTVTKRITCPGGRIEQRYYASAAQLPAFTKVRETTNKTEQRSAWNALIESGELPGLIQKVRSAGEIEPLMGQYEAAHPELLQPTERVEQFFGPRNIGGGKLDKFTKFVHLPAVREVSDEASGGRGATLAQLLDTLVMRKLQSRADVQTFKAEFGERLKALYAPEKTAELKGLAAGISETLAQFVPGAAFGLDFGDVALPEIPTPPAIPKLTEDEFEGDITRKGHGLQRALIFTLLQHLAVLQQEVASGGSRSGEEGEAGDKSPKGAVAAGPDLILAIEEPELYQHPQRCRYLADVLLELTADPSRGLGATNQVIYTTHSAYFVSLDRFEQIRVARKIPNEGTPRITTLSSFSLSEAAKRAAEVSGKDAKDFTASSFRVRAYPVMTTVVSEGFFASVVAVVEGMSEAGALWRLSEILEQEWKRRNVVVIPVDGKSKVDKPVIIFRGLRIPTYFAFDGDVRHRGAANEAQHGTQNALCLRLAGVEPVPFPPLRVEATWACFEDEFEGYCKAILGDKDFEAYRKAVADEFGYENPKDALKNFDAVGDFVERIYKDGKKLPALEEIVRAIRALYPPV